MKVLIDACVLYPTVMRQVVMEAAAKGLFTPLWSERILEEWARATIKLGPGQEALARGEVARLRADWPMASVTPRMGDLRRLHLPDPDDVHVLAAAIAGSADLILTMNTKDFPRHILAEEGLGLAVPDLFLLDLYHKAPDIMTGVAEAVRQEAERLSGENWPLRKLMKKARLPRFGKALDTAG